MSLRLGIDLDGVVADFCGGWIELYNEEFDATVHRDQVTSWGAAPQITHFAHMGEFWRWAMRLEGGSLFRHLPVYDDAVQVLESLAMWGHEIVILTSKPDWAVHDTFEWIAEHRLPTREVHMLDDKWSVPCDVYLDDAPHHLRAIRRQRPDAMVCRFIRPWNDPVDGVVDVESWTDYEKTIMARGLGGR